MNALGNLLSNLFFYVLTMFIVCGICAAVFWVCVEGPHFLLCVWRSMWRRS